MPPRPRRCPARAAPLLALILALIAPPAGCADGPPAAADDGLDGRDIYERVVDNRFHSFTQRSVLVSTDRAGRSQETRFLMHWQDFRDAEGRPGAGVVSKTLVRYTHPFDLRFAGYFIQANRGRANDQFVYYPSRRRVVRVSLRSEAVYGTDFSFEDVIPREAEDFDTRRLDDALWRGTPVHVVDLEPRPRARSEYSRIRVYVDRARFVVLRARYWSEAGVEVKEFTADPARVERFDGVWVPMASSMRNLLQETQTTLLVTELEPNPRFDRETFDLRRLEAH